ncbi:hypothetical protein RyT2_11640 [Pseudolactococcus yaeyamensis]
MTDWEYKDNVLKALIVLKDAYYANPDLSKSCNIWMTESTKNGKDFLEFTFEER